MLICDPLTFPCFPDVNQFLQLPFSFQLNKWRLHSKFSKGKGKTVWKTTGLQYSYGHNLIYSLLIEIS